MTRFSSAPVRITPVSALAPRRKPIAPTKRDLPAPVSPVRILSPPVKLTDEPLDQGEVAYRQFLKHRALRRRAARPG